MLKTKYLSLLTLLLIPLLIHSSGSAPSAPLSNPFTITFISETHQQISPSCYNAQINVKLQWTANSTFTVGLNNFYLYSTGSNLMLVNMTNYSQPNNLITFLILFPNVPVTLALSFTGFCIPQGLVNLQVWLFYFDGSNLLKTKIV